VDVRIIVVIFILYPCAIPTLNALIDLVLIFFAPIDYDTCITGQCSKILNYDQLVTV